MVKKSPDFRNCDLDNSALYCHRKPPLTGEGSAASVGRMSARAGPTIASRPIPSPPASINDLTDLNMNVSFHRYCLYKGAAIRIAATAQPVSYGARTLPTSANLTAFGEIVLMTAHPPEE